MTLTDRVWSACQREQQRLRRMEALAGFALAQGTTAYIQVSKRRSVLRRRVRRLELLLAKAYRRAMRMAQTDYAHDEAQDLRATGADREQADRGRDLGPEGYA